MKKLIVCAVLMLAMTGCHSVSYSRNEPNGEKITFSSSSLWTKKHIKDLEYEAGTNSFRKFRLRGYSDNQTEMIQTAIEAALRAYQNSPLPAGPARPTVP